MYKELNSLVSSYKGQQLDEDFVYDAFDIFRKGNPELEDFLIGIHVFDNEKDKAQGSYSFKTRQVCIHLNNVNKFNVIDLNLCYACIRNLAHEVEHARTLKKYLEYRNDIESVVTSFCVDYDNKMGAIAFNNVDNTYIYDPMERIAFIRSAKLIVNLLKNKVGSLDLENARLALFNMYLQGYEKCENCLTSPTFTYLLKKYNVDDYIALRKHIEDLGYMYSLDTRLLCGLPIKEEEIFTILTDKCKLNKDYMQRIRL